MSSSLETQTSEPSQSLELINSTTLSEKDYAIYQVVSLVSKQFKDYNFKPTENKIKKPLLRILSSPETINFILLAVLAIKNRMK